MTPPECEKPTENEVKMGFLVGAVCGASLYPLILFAKQRTEKLELLQEVLQNKQNKAMAVLFLAYSFMRLTLKKKKASLEFFST